MSRELTDSNFGLTVMKESTCLILFTEKGNIVGDKLLEELEGTNVYTVDLKRSPELEQIVGGIDFIPSLSVFNGGVVGRTKPVLSTSEVLEMLD